MAEQPALVALCNTADVSEDEPRRVERGGRGYAVYRLDGQFYVTQDLCTHGPGSLSEGYIEGCEIECPIHQGRFNIITGAATFAPCTDALRVWAVTVQDGQVWIDPAA